MKVYSGVLPKVQLLPETKTESATGGFGQLFSQLLQNTVNQQVQADQLSRQLALGETDDVQAVMLATEKASLAWQLLQQIRNKLTDAYEEVMRMQI